MAITAAELMVTVGADTTAAQQGVRSFGDQLNSMSREMGMAGMALSAGITAPVMAIGATSLMTAADFESSMNRVAALSGATGAQFDALKTQAMELGASTQFSASQAADAMGFLAMAGFKTDQILGAMPSTLQLAAAAQLDLGRAADITSNIMTGYGLKVDDLGRVNDVLVASFTNANTDLSMLGEAMKYAGPVASGMGMSFEESAAAISMMGNAGIQASMAGTALRGILVSLANPTAGQAKVMERLGVSAFDSAGNMLPLVDIMGQLEDSGADAATIMELFGQRAGPAMLALLDQGSGGLRDFTGMLEKSGGTAKRIADVQMQGLNGALAELRSAWEGVQIAFMDMGGLEAATGAIKGMIQWVRDGYTAWTELDPAIRNGVLAFGAVWVAAGPVLLALSGIAAGLAFLISPIGLVVAASALLAAGWVSDFGGMRTAVTEWWAGAQPIFTEAGDWLSQQGTQGLAAFQEGWAQLLDFMTPAISRLQESFHNAMAGFSDMSGSFASLGEAFGNLGNAILPVAAIVGVLLVGAIRVALNTVAALLEVLPVIIEIVVAKIANVLNTIAGILEAATALIAAVIDGDWATAWESLKTIGTTALAGLLTSLQLAGELFGIVLLALKDAVVNTLADFGVDVKDPFDAVEASVMQFWAWLTGLSWDEVWTGLGNGFAGLIDTMTSWKWPALTELLGWGWPAMPGWEWPTLPSWTWPRIPTPEWIDRLLNWRPSLPGLPFGGNASGTTNWGGGMTWVGERGPELIALPGGSRVFNNQESMAMAGGGGGVSIGEVHIHNDMDVEALINRIARGLERRMR